MLRALNPLTDDSLQHFRSIVSSKQDPRRSKLIVLIRTIRNRYIHYLKTAPDLDKIEAKSYSKINSEALRHCYNRESVAVERLIVKIIESQPRYGQSRCQYCGIGIPRSIDHYLPQEIFADFTVFSANLLPCCSDCNNLKGTKWLSSNGNRIILNPYFETLPETRLLFAKFEMTPHPRLLFFLQRPISMKISFFHRVSQHFECLQLATRYSLCASGEIDKAIAAFRNSRTNNIRNRRKLLLDTAINQVDAVGLNSWEAATYFALANSLSFLKIRV